MMGVTRNVYIRIVLASKSGIFEENHIEVQLYELQGILVTSFIVARNYLNINFRK